MRVHPPINTVYLVLPTVNITYNKPTVKHKHILFSLKVELLVLLKLLYTCTLMLFCLWLGQWISELSLGCLFCLSHFNTTAKKLCTQFQCKWLKVILKRFFPNFCSMSVSVYRHCELRYGYRERLFKIGYFLQYVYFLFQATIESKYMYMYQIFF